MQKGGIVKKIGLLIIHLTSIGCASCIAPTKILLLRTRGVKGVHVHNRKVVVIFDPYSTSPKDIINESKLSEYYKIRKTEVIVVDYNDLQKYLKPLSKYKL